MFYIDNDSGVTVMPPVSAQRSAMEGANKFLI